ncbi:transposase [Bacteroidia bacterium]|nr:transposase [Bacteroidia bacterium]
MNFNLFFTVRKRVNKQGVAPLEVAITINGERTIISLPRKLQPELWNQELQSAMGSDEACIEFNSFINLSRLKLYECQSKLLMKNIPVNIHTMKDMFNNKIDERKTSLVTIYQEHNDEYEALYKQKGVSYAAWQKHTTTLTHLKGYLKSKYNRTDIEMVEINKSFIDGWFNYIRTTLKIGHNTSVNYMKNLKKICLKAWNDGITQSNPFANIRLSLEKVDIGYLTMNEVKKIYNKDFGNNRLNAVRDIFIFSCFTGLAYIDCNDLRFSTHIVEDDNGDKWIMKNREKTNILSSIPLLPIAQQIIERYSEKDYLPVLSNQKMNSYLKETAVI